MLATHIVTDSMRATNAQ